MKNNKDRHSYFFYKGNGTHKRLKIYMNISTCLAKKKFFAVLSPGDAKFAKWPYLSVTIINDHSC